MANAFEKQCWTLPAAGDGQEAGAPWREPAKLPSLPSLNLKGLGGVGRSVDAFAEDFKVGPFPIEQTRFDSGSAPCNQAGPQNE